MHFLRSSQKWINASVYAGLRTFLGHKNVTICVIFSNDIPMTFFQKWNISHLYSNMTSTCFFVTFRCIFINIISGNYRRKKD